MNFLERMNISPKLLNYLIRYLVLTIGLFILALWIGLSTKANLGISPV